MSTLPPGKLQRMGKKKARKARLDIQNGPNKRGPSIAKARYLVSDTRPVLSQGDPRVETLKTCTKCKHEKPLTAFYRARAQPDDRAKICSDCIKAADRRRRQAEIEKGWLQP